MIVVFERIRRGPRDAYGGILRAGNTRRQVAVGAIALAVGLEFGTAVPGLRLLLAGAVVAAPAFLFVQFWRGLVWLRAGGNLDALLARRHQRDWRGWRLLWLAFACGWGLDLVATIRFFAVPTVRELHPVTVAFYQAAGIPGAIAAAVVYAGIVVALTAELPRPLDFDFLAVVTLWYGILVVHNFVLLLGGAT